MLLFLLNCASFWFRIVLLLPSLIWFTPRDLRSTGVSNGMVQVFHDYRWVISTLSLSDNMKQILPPIGRCWPISHYPATTYLCFGLWWWWWQKHSRPLDDLDILSLAMQAGGWGKSPVPLCASVALIISLQYDQLITQSLITLPLFTTIISMVTINIMCFFDIRDQGKRLRIMITEPLTSSKCGPIFTSAKKCRALQIQNVAGRNIKWHRCYKC